MRPPLPLIIRLLTLPVNVTIPVPPMAIAPDRKIDCLGLFCPMPILKTREAVKQLAAGQVLEMTSDDPASEADMKSWSSRTGHQLLAVERNGSVFRFLIRKS
jgi:tRNA 2-thiouridine synthesizing protein A